MFENFLFITFFRIAAVTEFRAEYRVECPTSIRVQSTFWRGEESADVVSLVSS